MNPFAKLFDRLPYSVPQHVPNSSVPLHFERYGTATPEPEKYYGIHDHLKSELSNSFLGSDVAQEQGLLEHGEFRSKVHEAAQRLALQAYSFVYTNQNEAIRLALESIKIKPVCDAYAVLALAQAKTFEEALEFYRLGQSVGPDMTTKFDKYVRERNVFAVHSLRGYFRCVQGEANTLRKMGRAKESVVVFEKLMQLDPNRYQYSSYNNFRTHMPEAYQKAGDWRAADRMLKQDPELTDMMSSMTTCLWSKALCDFVIRNERKFPSEYFYKSGVINLVTAIVNVPLPIHFMTGKIPLPNIPIPGTYEARQKERLPSYAHQANYASQNKELWESQPGALEWAERSFNTIKCIRVLKPQYFENFYDYEKEPNTYETFAKYVNSELGIFMDDVYTSRHASLLHDVIQTDDPRMLKLLIDKGINIKPSKVDLYPIHLACYYDRDPAIIQMLMDKGANVTDPGKVGLTPLAMTANQGNWRAMHTVFQKKPELKKDMKLLESLVDMMFNTSVYACVRGGEKCQRCTNDTVPHSKNISFEQCLKLIFSYGYKPSNKLLVPDMKSSFGPLVELFCSYLQVRPIESDNVV
jgi:tetratricopeptide (TPR) repeat protein